VPDYVLPEGLAIPSVQDILDRMSTEQRATIDPLLPTDPDSVIGSHHGIDASAEREFWEALLVAFWAMDPNKAEGVLLDACLALRGSKRKAASKSRFVGSRRLEVQLDAGGSITAGVTKFTIPGTTTEFVSTESHTNPGPGALIYLVSAEASVTGPVQGPANTVTGHSGGVGILDVQNDYDAVLGTDIETDQAFRRRSEQELARAGAGTYRSVRADLLALQNDDGSLPIRAVEIVENRTDSVDANGLLPHSYKAIIWDGQAQEADNTLVIETMFANHIPGIVGSAVRPTQKDHAIDVEILTTSEYAGHDAVKERLATWHDETVNPENGAGSGVVSFSEIIEALMGENGVPGIKRVLSVTQTFNGSSVVNDQIEPATFEIAVTSTALISVST
jgi:hypothetical protein